MSKRSEIRARQQRQSKFQTGFVMGLALLAVVVLGYLVYQGMQSVSVSSTSTYDPGKAEGPADAKVVVQEFSDFQ